MAFAPTDGPLAALAKETGVAPTRDGASIGYEVFAPNASGVPLVMLMGLAGLIVEWYPLPQLLAAGPDPAKGPVRPVILLDNRGMGTSTLPADWEGDMTMDHMALDVLDVLHHLKINKIDLMGWSMGGFIAQHIIAHQSASPSPDGAVVIEGIKIRKLLLTATMPRAVGCDMDPNEVAKLTLSTKDREEGKKRATRYMLELQYWPEWLKSPEHEKILLKRLEDSTFGARPQAVVGQQMGAILSAPDISPLLKEKVPASLPVAIIHGQRDRMVHPIGADLLAKAIPHAKRLSHPEIQDDFGHFWFDVPDTASWVSPIDQWLNQDAIPAARI